MVATLPDGEILVIGAGIIGSSVAMHLALKGARRVRVIDFDLEGLLSSSELNAGGVRGTWIQPVNILSSQVSIEYFSKVAEDVGYRATGYLWLHGPERFAQAIRARENQAGLGWPVETWDLKRLREKVPFIDKTNGIAGAIFAPRDGLINPNLLKLHYRKVARDRGVQFEDRCLVRSVEYSAQSPRVVFERLERLPETTSDRAAMLIGILPGHGRVEETRPSVIINCAGPWAPKVASVLGYESPSQPVRRQVCVFDCRDVDLSSYGMIVDTSGVYFHPEAMNGLAGFSNPDEHPGFDFTYDGENFFMESIWPALYERSTAFERLKHLTGWAGLYEVSPDESAIIGLVESGKAGDSGAVYEAHSFSGHGVMHSYAAGQGLAELVLSGGYLTIDFAPLSATRFAHHREVRETLVI